MPITRNLVFQIFNQVFKDYRDKTNSWKFSCCTNCNDTILIGMVPTDYVDVQADLPLCCWHTFCFCLIWFFMSKSTIFQLRREGSSWVEPVLSLAQGHNSVTRWGSNPRPFGLESSTLPLSHCVAVGIHQNKIFQKLGSNIIWTMFLENFVFAVCKQQRGNNDWLCNLRIGPVMQNFWA